MITSGSRRLIAGQTVEKLAELIDLLPKKERIVVTLYYYGVLNLKQIGARLNLK